MERKSLDLGDHLREGFMSPRKNRPAPDPRHAAVKEALAKYWAAENPALPDLPWSAGDAGALGALLRANPSLDVATFETCILNRMLSEDHAPGERVFRWIGDLLRYHAAPLDRYRLPKRPAQSSEANVGRNFNQPNAEEDRQWFLDRARRRKANGDPLSYIDQKVLREEGEL